MSKKSKETKKENNKLPIIIIVVAVLLLILLITYNKNPKYEIASRTDKIEEQKKKDSGNYNTIGWIRVQGTNIDYPVMVDKTGKYEEEIQKESFAISYSEEEKFYNNLTIMGHNIYNLGASPKKESDTFKRFESLMSFIYYDFAKENQYIQYTIDGKDYKYQIFAVTLLYELDYTFQLHYSNVTKEENKEEIEFLQEQSIYKYSTKVSEDDSIINVATCTRMFGKDDKRNFVISAKLVDNNSNKYSSVSKTKKYDEVEKTLEGGSEDEETA